MAEPQETQHERETRWAAQRVTRDTQEQSYRAARARARRRNWLIILAIVLIVAVVIVIMVK